MKKMSTIFIIFISLNFSIAFLLPTTPATAADLDEVNALMGKARITFDSFAIDPNMGWFQRHLKEAKAILIVPQLLKAAFLFGGAGGSGVLLVQDEKAGEWSEPAFYTIGSVSFGLQIGVKTSEMIIMVMTQNGLEELYTSSVNIGGEISAAVGPTGTGAEGATTPSLSVDFISFTKDKGIFIGLSLKGAILNTSDDMNSTYYNKSVRPIDIFVKKSVSNPKSAELRTAVAKTEKMLRPNPDYS